MKAIVVGGGSIGGRHIENLLSLGCKVGVVEPDPNRYESLVSDYDVVGFDSILKSIAWGPDVAIVATPNHLHIEHSLILGEQGCHLFIEKPLSHSLKGMDRLQAVIDKNEIISMVGCNMRFHPGPAMVKKLIEQNEIGQIISSRIQTGSYLPRWRPSQNYQQSYSVSPEWGGAILDCIHEIDLALWFFGSAEVVASVCRTAESIDAKTDGLAEILLYHQSDVLCNVHLNFIQHNYKRTCQVIGSKGTIEWDFNSHQVTVWGNDGEIKMVYTQPSEWQINKMYVDELNYFLDCVRHNRQTFCTIQHGREALEIALAVRQGKSV